MASTHNNSLVDVGAPAQVVYPPPPKEFALFASATSAFDFEEILHDAFTDNTGRNFKPHAEDRTHANDKEMVMCEPLVATSELDYVLQGEREHKGTTMPGSSNPSPELTEEFSQHKQVQEPPARSKIQLQNKLKQVRCNLSISYLEYRHRRICSMKARAAAAAANSWPPGILKRIWAALKFVFSCRFLLVEWALVNIDPLGPLAPLIFSLVYAMVGYWFVYSDPFEGLLIKMCINIISIVWAIDCWPCLKSSLWPSRRQSDCDNTLEYFRQLDYERASILRSHGIS